VPIIATCPACGCHGDVETFFVDADAKRLSAAFADMDPALGRAVIAYLRLFKPTKNALRLLRAARIVADLSALVESGTVCRDERSGMSRATTPALWTQGIEQLLDQRDRLTLPLSNHHYLRAIVFGLAEQVMARAEAKAEQSKRTGQQRRTTPSGHTEAETARDREIAFVRQICGYGEIDDAERDARIEQIQRKYHGGQ